MNIGTRDGEVTRCVVSAVWVRALLLRHYP